MDAVPPLRPARPGVPAHAGEPGDPPQPGREELRRTVLMVCVLDGVDVQLGDDTLGVEVDGASFEVAWGEVARAVGAAPPESAAARSRLRTWWRLRGRLTTLRDPAEVARPVGLPVGHVLHPGAGWVRHRVLGGALDVGIGLLGLLEDPDEVVVAPPELLRAAGLDAAAWWPDAVRYLEDKGRVAADRLLRDTTRPLRPIGDCDVVTLLASPTFRAGVCDHDPRRMRSAAVPMRRRGWLDLSRVDPAFAVAAAAATDPVERGFERPVLVTCEEITMAPAGGRPASQVLGDPVPSANAWNRSSVQRTG